jgi:hypothetical protein
MLEYRQKWILDERPRGGEHQSFGNYKSAKYLFRDELRKANENYEKNASNLIEDSFEFDQKTAWSLINCRRSRKSNAVILKTNGNLLTDPNDVCNEFAKHFEQIAKIPNDDPDIVKRVSDFRTQCCDGEIRHIETDELSKLLKGLSNNKACGIDGITYEHLKYGGKLLEKHLCNLFNMIFDKCVAPNGWKTSMIIPLHKGGSKPKTDCDAYRGISLICKVFEKLLDCRIDERLNNFPNTQQMAYQKCLNSMFASFDLQEVIHYYIERHSVVIVTFLDSMKAFDTVSHNGLKVKLFDLGIIGKMWNLLDKIYSNLKSCVRCNNQTSRYFDLSRGIRQGSVLSAKLYLIYIDELINILSKSGKGAIMVDLNGDCPVQADDIALISSNVPFMQSLIDICVQYSKRWKFKFCPVKNQVMKFTKHTMHINLRLDNNIIPECKTLKHVGIILENGFNSTERTITACRLIRSLSMSIIK